MNDVEISEVSVTVHEKRNHPHEYGHYDCEVRLTAKIPQAKLVYHPPREARIELHSRPAEETEEVGSDEVWAYQESPFEPDVVIPSPEPQRTVPEMIASLRTEARAHVKAECDEWLARIEAEREAEREAEANRNQARMKLRHKRWNLDRLQREIEEMERGIERGDVDPDAWPDDDFDDDEEPPL